MQATFQNLFQTRLEHFYEQADAPCRAVVEQALRNPETQLHLQRCWLGSAFTFDLCQKNPHWLQALLEQQTGLLQSKTKADYERELQALVANVTDEEVILRCLRDFRNQAMLRIIWRDFNRLADTRETCAELSALADVCIEIAQHFFHQQLAALYGEPLDKKGRLQQLLVIAMGKLGAGELNLSSDIDLIFVFPEKGQTNGTDKNLSNQEFFIKLGQKLIRALDQTTADGFVFRVDMRLRPHGESGALALNFDALEDYYQRQGRSWERYAMIKARVVTGLEQDRQALYQMLRPFTYRRYMDFSAIEALRDMKAMIAREVKRKGYAHNIKLGSGGIREIEFIVQVFQLIRGGRHAELQTPALLDVLPLLQQQGLLPSGVINELREAYLYLRNLEHAIQGYEDRQTQLLPTDTESLDRLALVMAEADRETLLKNLDYHRQRVAEHFNNVIRSEDESEQQQPVSGLLQSLWLEQDDAAAKKCLDLYIQQQGLSLTEEKQQVLLEKLFTFKNARSVIILQKESAERLNSFMPLLLQVLLSGNIDNPVDVYDRIEPLLLAVLRRSAYLLLLIENPQALDELVMLAAASPWIANEIAEHPVLLDELLDSRNLFSLPPQETLREQLADELRQQLMRIPLEDLEGQMEALRYFKQAHRLRVAACEVTERLPLMKVSDYLTALAEVILQQALAVAWDQLTEKHGLPTDAEGNTFDARNPGFCIIAYGKLGGLELGHNSDLDIVFLHDAKSTASTQGDRAIDNATFYMRLGQRIIHILETRTPSGRLYEVDTRLRPSGNSGLLVSTLSGFEKYQQEKAWTWEHQALVRARPVCGSAVLMEQFNVLRQRILCETREQEKLRADVLEMREKMREALGSSQKGNSKTGSSKTGDSGDEFQTGTADQPFHLKHDAGGIVDIEFMVQYAVLRWAEVNPALCEWTDNIRILETLATCELISLKDSQQLIESYKMLRCAAHRQALQQQGSVVAAERYADARKIIMAIWQHLFEQQ